MKTPNKIYVEICEDGIFAFPEPPFKESVEYIRKDALWKWAEDCIAEIRRSPNFNNDLATKCTMYAVFQDKLNSM